MTRTERIDRFFFAQPNAILRVCALRAMLGAVIAVLVVLGPYGRFHVDMADVLYRPTGVLAFLPPLDAVWFDALRMLVIASAVMVALGVSTRASCIALAAAFFVLNYYVSQFVGPVWSYNTHLNWFAIALCFVPAGARLSIDERIARVRARPSTFDEARGEASASFVIAFMQLYIALLYTQAGLAKLLGSGVAWFTSGLTPLYFTLTDGTALGRWLAQWPALFRVFSLASGLIELLFLPLFPFPRIRRALVIAALLMHVGIHLVMDIPFWHMWLLYPVLFLWKSR